MKRFIYLAVLLFSIFGNAQSRMDYGVKGGLNYNSNGELNIFGGFTGQNNFFESNTKIGYQFGVFTAYTFDKFYVKSEFYFSKTNSIYDDQQLAIKFNMSSIEIPFLLGYTIIKPLSIYGGPSTRFILNSTLSSLSLDLEIDKNIVFDLNIGSTVQIDKIGIDLRYVYGLSNNKALNTNNLPADGLGYSLETKPSLFILSFFYQIN